MEAANRDLATKLTQLQLTRDKTEAVLTSLNGNRIKRHRDALFAVLSSVDRAKRKVEELKIAAGEEIADITTWSDKVDVDTAAVDDDMERISKCLNEIDQEQVNKARAEQLAFEKGVIPTETSVQQRASIVERKAKHESRGKRKW